MVIANGKISLDTKLGIFTVLGTNEPRVVQLFPTSSCSCPAKANCYHVKAAEMAIGMRKELPKRLLNLTLLRRNKRKQADKTSGRKRPRVDDVDIVPAPDADDNAPIIADLQNTIAVADAVADAPQPSDDVEEAELDDVQPTVQEVCSKCTHSLPPPAPGRKSKNIPWVECELCSRWFHNACVGLRRKNPVSFVCEFCAN